MMLLCAFVCVCVCVCVCVSFHHLNQMINWKLGTSIKPLAVTQSHTFHFLSQQQHRHVLTPESGAKQ
jgi:hypothetical protein